MFPGGIIMSEPLEDDLLGWGLWWNWGCSTFTFAYWFRRVPRRSIRWWHLCWERASIEKIDICNEIDDRLTVCFHDNKANNMSSPDVNHYPCVLYWYGQYEILLISPTEKRVCFNEYTQQTEMCLEVRKQDTNREAITKIQHAAFPQRL